MVSVKFINSSILFSFTIFAFSSFAKAAVLGERNQSLRFGKDANPVISVHTNSSISRIKRDVTCRNNQWRCLYQHQCIDKHSKCDGPKDCIDGSDETFATCRNKECPQYLFRCSYGACVSRGAKCDGEQHCADNSDEENVNCKHDHSQDNSNCSSREWRCDNKQCIRKMDTCDGVSNCWDGSDETLRLCSLRNCASYLFRCAYGACVDRRAPCNGVPDCADESDESPELCNTTTLVGSSGHKLITRKPLIRRTNVPPSPTHPVFEGRSKIDENGTTCVLPEQPKNGVYLEYSVDGNLVLIYYCNKMYSINGENMTICSNGFWMSEIPTCEKQCEPLVSPSMEFECYKPNSIQPSTCNQRHDHGTRMKGKCKESYNSEFSFEDVTCTKGSWNSFPSCEPDCGMLTPQAEPLVMNGRDPEIGEFPWHVGIYTMPQADYKCGGSIFSPKLVVTAAHCVYTDGVGKHSPEKYSVAAGKHYMHYDRTEGEHFVQKANVTEIITAERYRGAANGYQSDIAILVLDIVLEINFVVQPICIKFEDTTREGQLGKVAGWGRTAPDGPMSGELKAVDLPFVSFDECYEKSPLSFRACITNDKLCAGYTNGTGLCHGDSGGGLVLPHQQGLRQVYYLQGIVSMSPKSNTEECHPFAYIAFTDIRKHKEWILDIWETHK